MDLDDQLAGAGGSGAAGAPPAKFRFVCFEFEFVLFRLVSFVLFGDAQKRPKFFSYHPGKGF